MSGGIFDFHASRLKALDGVRGIAILLVFAVHTTPVLLRGGRIGVDLFFVLSGFLITSILLQEYRERGSIHLGYFYVRRALRLLPALFSVLFFVGMYVAVLHPEQLQITLWNIFGAAFYFFNWQLVAEFPDYLNHQWMLSHVWSLSVEEQFYIFWPLIVLLLFNFNVPQLLRYAVVIAGIVVPAVARWIAWDHEHTLQIYFRTDLRIDGLMWGALAAMLVADRITPSVDLLPRFRRLAPIALGCLLAIATMEGLANGFLYRAGFPIVGLCAALLIYCTAVCPMPSMNNILENDRLCWIGKVSYGLYLWHWPIIRAVSELKLAPLLASLLEFSLTFAIAAISFYYWEKPFLQLKDRFTAMKPRLA